MSTDPLSLMKDMTRIASGIKNMELNTKIMQIQGEMYSLLDENRELRIELEAIKKAKQAALGIKKYGDFYYLPNDSDPICSKCYEVDSLIVHAQEMSDYETFLCPNCKNSSFRTREYVKQN